ncbi:hypothetical protein DFH08DRAFT_1075891, partial [Mycena albidolilacea]
MRGRVLGPTGALSVSKPLPSGIETTACSTKSSSQSSLWLWYRASLASLRPSRTFPVAREQTGIVTSSFAELVGLLLDIVDHARHIRQFSHAKTCSGGGFPTRLWRDATQLWEGTVHESGIISDCC